MRYPFCSSEERVIYRKETASHYYCCGEFAKIMNDRFKEFHDNLTEKLEEIANDRQKTNPV